MSKEVFIEKTREYIEQAKKIEDEQLEAMKQLLNNEEAYENYYNNASRFVLQASELQRKHMLDLAMEISSIDQKLDYLINLLRKQD